MLTPRKVSKVEPEADVKVFNKENTTTDMISVVTVAKISKRYPIKRGYDIVAIDAASLKIEVGETVAIVGESGSGKSTLLYAIMRLIRIDSGAVFYRNMDVTRLKGKKLREQRGLVQFIPQDPFASLNPRRKVFASIAQGMIVESKLSEEEAIEKVAVLLEKVGLKAEMMFRYPYEFSGGERQRICVARALATNPRLIVADEPTAALDLALRDRVLDLLISIQRDADVGILLATHDFSVVERMAQKVVVMLRGRIVEYGFVNHVLSNPQHSYTKRLLEAVPSNNPRNRGTLKVEIEFDEQRVFRKNESIGEPVYRQIGLDDHYVAEE